MCETTETHRGRFHLKASPDQILAIAAGIAIVLIAAGFSVWLAGLSGDSEKNVTLELKLDPALTKKAVPTTPDE